MKNQLINCLWLITMLVACNVKNNETSGTLGELQHDFAISKETRQSFDRGLLLLHSFEYEDAREAFQEAIDTDSTELMAHWGKAMTYYKALWGLQDLEAGRRVINKLGSTKEERLSKAKSALGRDFWVGLEILYGEGDLDQRNDAYAEYMESLYRQYEGNQEVAAFYALSLMWSVELGRDSDTFDKSGRIAEGILNENPNHPGALHYMIHAYDDPQFAENGKEAADKYAKVALDATHALHMPSHIYLSLGMWNDMVSSNEASYSASVKRMKRKELSDAARGFHSYAWLHYGYLQQGRIAKAEKLLIDMKVFTKSAQTRGARGYMVSMQGAQLIESGVWPTTLTPSNINTLDLGLTTKARQHFFRSLMAYNNESPEIISQEIDTLWTHISAAELVVTTEGIALCSAGPTRYAPNKNDVLCAKTMTHQMQALKAMLENNDSKVEHHLKQATVIESEVAYSFGPPDIQLPSFEQYGEWLLTKSRYEEALEQFNISLQRAPNRAKALIGKMKALKKLGRMGEVTVIQETLNEFWKQGLVAFR